MGKEVCSKCKPLFEMLSKRFGEQLMEQDKKIRDLQQMRDYRNRISYEGFMIHRNYISLNKEKIQNIIKSISSHLKQNE